jgi:PTS system nitrogen regulatory IIA component
LHGLLALDQVAIDVSVSSKKRLMEEVATLLIRGNSSLNKDTVFHLLVARERLGSTGIGHGIAIPHARLNGIQTPTAACLLMPLMENPYHSCLPWSCPQMPLKHTFKFLLR